MTNSSRGSNHECDDKQLLALLDDRSTEAESISTLEHLEGCRECQRRLRELTATDADWNLAVQALSTSGIEAMSLDTSRWKVTSAADFHPEWTEAMAKRLLASPTHPEMLGRIGRYDVERLVGAGGMGLVFKAYDVELNRTVAVKMLAPYLAASGPARSRFAREAKAAAAVVNDHVVPIYNVDCDHESPFLVMQYVAGGSLQSRLDHTGPLEICEVLRIGMHIAKGLAAAHTQGLVHRDVKPSNILLDEGIDRALLSDFGLARTADEAGLTRSGFHPGTPHYMSPEQVLGKSLNALSDLFSLGCVLYEMCTGYSPFRGQSSFEVFRSIQFDQPESICESNSKVPDWLERLVFKLLSKSTNERFGSAREVSKTLEDCLAYYQQPTTVPPPPWVSETRHRRSPNWGVFSVAVTTFGGLVGASYFFWPVNNVGKAPATHLESPTDSEKFHHESGDPEFDDRLRNLDIELQDFEKRVLQK